ncbi:MAG: CYTH domain-containing protein [Lachnospiraceae bacterium]|nr:CYTH domain-containing protein [Lachnospiraceae bacterium]
MEIERKYLIDLESVPFDYKSYPAKVIEQGYLSTAPVVRVRKSNDSYELTYKGKGNIEREEYNHPLTKEAYEHLVKKADGCIIKKIRYNIPYLKYTIELDVFLNDLAPLVVAEVEFETREEADSFTPPDWFGEDVSDKREYKNSYLSGIN